MQTGTRLDNNGLLIHGKIEMIIGPMFSGKSTELLRRCKRYTLSGKKVLLINHTCDTRYGENIVGTHDGAASSALALSDFTNLVEITKGYDVIAIDEAQFFEIIPCVLAEMGKIVIVAGLSSTYERQPFTNVCNLICNAESVTKLTAVCSICGRDASFTKRLTLETELHIIGSKDKYTPRCRTCFAKK